MLPPGTDVIGGYWTRSNDPEIDLVGADKAPVARRITLVGSIKWLERDGFDSHDLGRLIVHRSQLPGADSSTPLLAITRTSDKRDLGVQMLTPEDLLAAYGEGLSAGG